MPRGKQTVGRRSRRDLGRAPLRDHSRPLRPTYQRARLQAKGVLVERTTLRVVQSAKRIRKGHPQAARFMASRFEIDPSYQCVVVLLDSKRVACHFPRIGGSHCIPSHRRIGEHAVLLYNGVRDVLPLEDFARLAFSFHAGRHARWDATQMECDAPRGAVYRYRPHTDCRRHSLPK